MKVIRFKIELGSGGGPCMQWDELYSNVVQSEATKDSDIATYINDVRTQLNFGQEVINYGN